MTKDIAEKVLEIERKKEEVIDELKEGWGWDYICKQAVQFLLKNMGAIS